MGRESKKRDAYAWMNRRDFISLTAAGSLAYMIPGCGSMPGKHPNILFVIVDDLRPELGCYGNNEIKTPNFDNFAKGATVFNRAHCQAAACAPSRASVMIVDLFMCWDYI